MSRIAAPIFSQQVLADMPSGDLTAPPIVTTAGLIALAAAAGLALVSPVLAAGAAYAGVFWLIARKWPAIALALAFAVAPFQNDLSAGGPIQDDSSGGGGLVKFSLAEVNLALALPVFLLMSLHCRRALSLGPMTKSVVIYLAVCASSAVVSWHGSAVTSFMQMIIYLVVAMALFAFAVSEGMDLRPAFYGLVLISLVLAVAVLVVRSGFVFDMHKNGVGGSLALGLVVCIELWLSEKRLIGRWLAAAAMLVIAGGLILTLSRGGWVEAGIGLVVLLVLRGRVTLMLKLALALIPVVAFTWQYLPDESKEYAAGFDSDRQNIRLRYDSIDYAIALFKQDPIFGNGLGLRKEYDATNVALLTLAETGVPGFLAFLYLHYAFLKIVWRVQRVLSRDDPRFSLMAVGAALVPAKLAHGMVDHYWSRGTIMLSWGSAGMTLGMYFLIERCIAAGAVEYDGQPRTRQARIMNAEMSDPESSDEAETTELLQDEPDGTGDSATPPARPGLTGHWMMPPRMMPPRPKLGGSQ